MVKPLKICFICFTKNDLNDLFKIYVTHNRLWDPIRFGLQHIFQKCTRCQCFQLWNMVFCELLTLMSTVNTMNFLTNFEKTWLFFRQYKKTFVNAQQIVLNNFEINPKISLFFYKNDYSEFDQICGKISHTGSVP